jgi:nicotinate dehydrogenase subunit B
MAQYLASLNTASTESDNASRAAAVLAQAAARAASLHGPAQRMFETACGGCHHDGNGPVELGLNLPLALHSSLHSPRPDNLLQAILEGVRAPATSEIGPMPAFKHSLSDRQIAELAAHMRQRFAPNRPAWTELEAAVARVRAGSVH